MTRTRAFRQGADLDPAEQATPAFPEEKDATEKQLGFIRSLLDERELTEEQLSDAQEQLEAGIAKAQASEWISRLLEKPKKSKPVKDSSTYSPLPDVPAGRYAVTGEDGTTDFYKVDRPTDGRWKGYTFVKLLVAHGGFGDDLDEQRVAFKATRTVLQRVLDAGIRESMERYGKAIGRCGHCGRNLTDNESIERGIGPVCAGKMGWS